MDKINGVNQYQKAPEHVQAQQTEKIASKAQENKEVLVEETKKQQEAVVYEKSNPLEGISTYDKKGKKLDAETIEKMKNEAEMHYSKMIETVKQMIAKQSKEAGGIPKEFDFFNRIPKSIAELNATKGFEGKDKLDGVEDHIGEDLNDPNSYWSAEKTAERIVDFAKKISGGDIKKYETLKNAIEKGFDAASSYFDKMPDITGKTHELVMKGLDEWAGKTEEKDPKKEVKTTQAAAL